MAGVWVRERLLAMYTLLLVMNTITHCYGADGEVVTWQEEAEAPNEIIWGESNTIGAYFDYSTENNVSAVVGKRARLPCRVINLDKKDVSWIRKRDLHILTVGIFTYTSDDRFKVRHPEASEDWDLEISPVTFRDAGVYECQVSTSPKIFLPVHLSVEVQQAVIPGLRELFIQNGSTIRLTCVINTHSENVGTVTWYRDNTVLDYDSPRGGVSVEIEKTPEKVTSKLFLTQALKGDTGNYTCAPEFAESTGVVIHVVTGEESAAVHTADGAAAASCNALLLTCCCALLLLLLLPCDRR